MENTIKQKIIAACQDNSLSEFKGFKQTNIDRIDNYSYEIKANSILQTHYNIICMYGSAHAAVPDKIIVLGYCDDLSFLDSL